jgi:uncharacterized protein (TIGR00156 family)
MKYAVSIVTVVLFGLLSTAYAEPVNQAALSATQVTAATVAQAKTLADDSKVTLKGQILRSLGNEKYDFKDATGTIVVDIDDELWKGQPVSTTATVTLLGEIDHDSFPKKTVEVDVEEIQF